MSERHYQIKESKRAQRLRIAVYPGGKVVVTKPEKMAARLVEEFVASKADWIEKKQEVAKEVQPDLEANSYKHFLFNRGKSRELVREKLQRWNEIYNFEYRRISIKQLKSRWGSCSANGSLSFNYKILFLPEEAQDYIVVHELCHLKEKNHSKNFWSLVELTQPNHKRARVALKGL